MSGLSTTLRFNGLPSLGVAMLARAQAVVKQTALDLEEEAQRNAHVITGSMQASVYHAIAGGDSDYGSHASDAASLNKYAVIEDELKADGPPGMAAVVGVAVMHGIFEEERSGHQFLLPAAETMRPKFEAAMRGIAG